jgi:adenine phosphoribosyltransferase
MRDWRAYIRDVPDFPKPGILFKDITPLLGDATALREVVEALAAHYADAGVETVAAVEARGFILGGAVATQLGAGFVPLRKPGKLPYRTAGVEYALEYGMDGVEAHEDAFAVQPKVLLVDDVLATGGTLRASAELIERLGGRLVGIAVLVELTFLGGRERLEGYDLFSLMQF